MIIISDIYLTLGMSFYHSKVQFSYLQSHNTDGSIWSLRFLPTPELFIFSRKIENKETTQVEKGEPSLLSGPETLTSVSHPATDKE